MSTKRLFHVSGTIEILVGAAMMVAPTHVVGWLLGEGLTLTGAAVSRVLGVGLVSLGISTLEPSLAARVGLCTYNLSVALLLALFGTQGGMDGVLLWPAAVLHAVVGSAMLVAILAPTLRALQLNDKRL